MNFFLIFFFWRALHASEYNVLLMFLSSLCGFLSEKKKKRLQCHAKGSSLIAFNILK